MIQALRFQDEKSDKFWRIETDGCKMVTNWGKTGTAGRYEMKEFEKAEECVKQAGKLVASKRKRGYQPMPDFDPVRHCYYDTDEFGPHPLTSHPIFRHNFSDGIYYDCGDEEAPFGSDEGSDAFYMLQERFRKRPNLNFEDFPRFLVEEEWGLTYLPPDPAQTDDALKAEAAKNYNGLPGEQERLQTDQVILATAFGQLKITGTLDAGLQSLAVQSLDRMERLYRLLWNWNAPEPPYNITIMRRDLQKFAQEFRDKR